MITLNDAGEEIEVFTKEEVEAQLKEKDDALGTTAKERDELKEKLSQRTDDLVKVKHSFKKFEELTAQEKAELSEREKEQMIRMEQLESQSVSERNAAKEAMFAAAAKGDEKVLAKIKEKYAIVQMPEGTTQEIMARINAVTPWAYTDLGIVERQPVSIESAMMGGGGLPRSRDGAEKKFPETEKGKAVENLLFGDILNKDNK